MFYWEIWTQGFRILKLEDVSQTAQVRLAALVLKNFMGIDMTSYNGENSGEII